MLKIFVVYAVSGSKTDVNLHIVIRSIARLIKRTDVAVLCLSAIAGNYGPGGSGGSGGYGGRSRY